METDENGVRTSAPGPRQAPKGTAKLDIEAMYAVFEAAIDSIIIIDDFGEIHALNHAAVQGFGYDRSDELIGRNVSMLMPTNDAIRHDGYLSRYRTTGERRIIGTGRVLLGRRKDNTEFPLHLSVSEFQSHDRRMFAGICHQETALDEFNQRIEWMSTHDELTGALNRHGAANVLGEAVRAGHERGNQLAVMVIDLDGFKQVNDAYGHQTGDELLVQAVRRIRSQLRESDIVARMGGDEFLAIIHGATHHLCVENAGRIVQSLQLPFVLDDRLVTIGASIGISLFPEHAETPDELVNLADLAMFEAKRTANNSVRMFDRALRDQAAAEYRLVAQLRAAIDAGQLVLHYQPQFDLETLEPVGIEALVRWNHPERGLVLPDDFLPLALAHGLMPSISLWVLRRACEDNAELIERGLLDAPVAVNIGAPLFSDPSFLALVEDVLARTGLMPDRLEVEVVENVAMTVSNQTEQNAAALVALGVTLAMDDFGTGYSSLQQLADQHFNKLKIDRSFVGRLPGSARDGTIVTASLEIADGLGMSTTAEGIETGEQRDYLQARGCQYGQGYWYARPMPFDALVPWLEESGAMTR